jgi:acyl-CoA synthetase (AMP-forming)/AMP-acid ligase II
MYPGYWASAFPDKAAAIDTGSGAAVTYRELDNRSNQLARLMYSAGLRRGDHLAVFMENHLRYFEVAWAALRSGLYLTTVNRYLTHEEPGYILDNCEAKVFVASRYLGDVAQKLPALARACETWLMVDGTVSGFDSYDETIARFSTEPLPEQPAGAFMLYSSGTTGRPKGIYRPLPTNNVDQDAGPIAALQRALWGFDHHSVYLSPAPMYLSAPLGFTTATQALGGTVVMMPRFDEGESTRGDRTLSRDSFAVGTDDVRADAEVAHGGTHEIRPLVAQDRDSRRGTVPPSGEAANVQLVGTDPVRVLRRD